ncbi:MAG TPA: hemerythrin domain-containing protein [Chitinophagaceae bacterium]|jgi:hemerythrin-like domain-containing protein|nr:hemerythrin domain-containing protein [Chitinophagaceae bacterium]
MDEIKPLKRSKELAPLSREHHDGLLFAWKIKQGLANGTAIETLCNYTRWFWSNHIKPHFKEEEKVLVKFLPENNALVKQMFREHAQIRDLIISLDKEPDLSSVQLLAEFLNNHIRFEERELFAYAERTLTQEQLNEIYKELPNDLQCDTEWKDEFWVRK